MISTKENGALAKHLFGQALSHYDIPDGQLTVHQDRGAPMIAETYRDLLASFGVEPSYSRPRVSNDNAASESMFKTLKYSPAYPGRFADLDEARAWMAEFIDHYQARPHEGITFYTPADVFHGRIEAVYERRQAALHAHYAAHPERYPNGPPQGQATAHGHGHQPAGGHHGHRAERRNRPPRNRQHHAGMPAER